MAWTLQPSIVEKSKNYIRWKLHCVSDGSALAITDIFSETYMPRDMKPKVQGLTYTGMELIHSGGGTTSTFTITLSDTQQASLYSKAAISNSATSQHDLSDDISRYPTFYSKMYLTITDVGNSGESFDLYFECWKEPSNP